MKHHTLFFQKFGKMLKNLSSAAVVIGALRVRYSLMNESHLIFNVKFHIKTVDVLQNGVFYFG